MYICIIDQFLNDLSSLAFENRQSIFVISGLTNEIYPVFILTINVCNLLRGCNFNSSKGKSVQLA